MHTNALPLYDDSINTTGCCPKFNPDGWDGQTLHFDRKPFLRATTKSALHIPINMGKVFARVQRKIEAQGGFDPNNTLVLSRDLSPWEAEHLFAVSKPIAGEDLVHLSGDYITKVFEGPYRKAKDWHGVMQALVLEQGAQAGEIYFFFTTCPKCAKAYDKNYVVGVARLGARMAA